jgi:trehalose/maltose hydrolase-like predicted phosphorylase
LLITGSIHNKKIDAGLPARGLHGEAYRGHIFWDTLFVLPFFNLHFPEISRSFLLYRFERLDAARKNAQINGYNGAMFPWQSADTGYEESQKIHYNPLSKKWDPDFSSLQRHVSISIFYNILQYFYCTMDTEFLYKYGLEIIIEISRFWVSIAKYNENDKKYHIENIMGPDEFHEKYPDNKKGGLRDNAYTNIMVSWLLHKTIKIINHVPENIIKNLSNKINFIKSELEKWDIISKKLYVEITKNNIISQFYGFLDLKEIDLDKYKKEYGNIQRMDRILKSEGDSPDNYKIIKQADVLMLYYLLSPGQVANILTYMGIDDVNPFKTFEENYNYYSRRTSNGSTLSYVVHSAISKYFAAKNKNIWEGFLMALKSDFEDIQGGTTEEGIHCGVMGGVIDIIIKTFTGINFFKDHIELNPRLPKEWSKLSFKIFYKNNWYKFLINKNYVKVKPLSKDKKSYMYFINNEKLN